MPRWRFSVVVLFFCIPFDSIPRPNRGRSYDSSRDGRLIMSTRNVGARNTAERPSLVVVLNWFEEVERLAPGR